MGQMHKIGTHKTIVKIEKGILTVKYHDTIVVSHDFKGKFTVLNSGGHKTATTKTRMNQTASQYDLDFRVYQKDFVWYVWFPSNPDREPIPFHNRMILSL